MKMAGRLKGLTGEQGGMNIALEAPGLIHRVPASPAWQGLDFDTEEEWEKAQKCVEKILRKA
jgi:CTP:molybdopterin cytidylyltransferase MocA